MGGALLGGGVESRGSEPAQLIEDCLSGGLITDQGTNIVAFNDVGQDGEVAGLKDLREELSDGCGCRWLSGGGARGSVVGGGLAKGCSEFGGGLKEAKVAIVVGEPAVVGVDRDTAAHAGRESRRGRVLRGVGGRGLSPACVLLGLLFGFGVSGLGDGVFVLGGGFGGVVVGAVVAVVVVVVGQMECGPAHGEGRRGDRGMKGDR